eukprot:CAMPEP_0172316750 /NCGR_PEP_ID=MMETSP1058-20130122/29371_1 /TAXON_ID=83371 /ORGANISM="Detonula confervacea, Strain CCMP 353" /LENGTH=214 /DNA_ID=CAMNT_0013031149 /DNA_START=80 /DNA_END=721 /DNA_ORIENTATION=-
MAAADDDVPITRELCRSVMPTGFAIIAFALAFIGCVQCDVIKFTSTSGFEQPITVQFGFWSHEDIGFYTTNDGTSYMVLSCTRYSQDVDIDSKWKAAAAFSILPLIIGGIHFLLMTVAKCTVNHWYDCIFFLLSFLFQGLSILFLDSNACKNNSVIAGITDNYLGDELAFQETCSMSTGMKCIIASMVFWGLATLTSADAYRAKKQKEEIDAPL